MSQIPSYWLIGVHKERQHVLGYRVASLKHKKYIDLTEAQLVDAVKQQPKDFGNIAVEQNKIVGTQGQLDRYTAIRGTRAENKALVVLAKVVYRSGEISGFIVIDYRYSFCGLKSTEDIIQACVNPLRLKLANASIVENGNTKFIRAINGEFITIVDEKAPYYKPVKSTPASAPVTNAPVNPVNAAVIGTPSAKPVAPATPVNSVKIIKKDGFEYRYGQQLTTDGEWKDAQYEGYGMKFIGFEQADDEEDHYVVKPLKYIDGKPVIGMQNAFGNIKNSLIDLREFSFNNPNNVDGIFKDAKACWVFVDNVENTETFSKMFVGQVMTIVTQSESTVQREATSLQLRVVPFRKVSIQEWYHDSVERHSKGRGFGVVVCCRKD